MRVFEVEIGWEIRGIHRVPVEARSYKEAVKKFQKKHGIPEDAWFFDGMEYDVGIDLNTMDSFDCDIEEE